MRNVTTRPRFLSQDQGLYDPLTLGVSSSSYSTMSQIATGHSGSTPERYHPVVEKRDEATTKVSLDSTSITSEPIVTRKELWSYYCICYHLLHVFVLSSRLVTSVLQRRQRTSITLFTVGMDIEDSMRVGHIQGVGPIGAFSLSYLPGQTLY